MAWLVRNNLTHGEPMMDDSKATLIDALFALLPPEDCAWPIAERVKWLRAAAAIIDLLYGNLSEGRLEVRIYREAVGAGDFPVADPEDTPEARGRRFVDRVNQARQFYAQRQRQSEAPEKAQPARDNGRGRD